MPIWLIFKAFRRHCSLHLDNSLVSETQYATELVVSGLRHLCQVPIPADILFGRPEDARYELHVGLHAYTSGVERLGKLSLSCQGYLLQGKFPAVERTHRLSTIFGKLSRITFSSQFERVYAEYPKSNQEDYILDLLDRFAQGAGRYEYLDSLVASQVSFDTYGAWKGLCRALEVSEGTWELINLYDAIPNAVYRVVPGDLEIFLNGFLNDDRPVFLPSSCGVAEVLFEKARWVAAGLSDASTELFYGSQAEDIPLLSEIVAPALLHRWELFFECHIAQLGDATMVGDTLAEIVGSEDLADELDE